ncbi:MAG: hypothetical protein ABH804_02635 [archaeon]
MKKIGLSELAQYQRRRVVLIRQLDPKEVLLGICRVVHGRLYMNDNEGIFPFVRREDEMGDLPVRKGNLLLFEGLKEKFEYFP